MMKTIIKDFARYLYCEDVEVLLFAFDLAAYCGVMKLFHVAAVVYFT